MQIVGALDVHRRQITYKTLDLAGGEVRRGRLSPADRASVREWLERFEGCEAEFALEGTTGGRFVAEEIERAGHVAHLADPAETAAKRGSKRRAKTDRADCDLQLKLLLAGELPESWIPPAHILELGTRVRTRKTLVDQRSAWQLRLTAQLFHQGVPAGVKPRTRAGRDALARVELSPAGRELVSVALRMIDVLDVELVPFDRERFAASQPGCRALSERLYGVGPAAATAILAELGDCRRFTSSDDAVRHAGLDVTVYQSDSKRAAGHLSHEGAPVLRWALYEAGQRPPATPRPTISTSCRCATGPTTRAPCSRSPASSAAAPTTSCASSASRRSHPSTSMHPLRRRCTLPPEQPIAVRASSSSRRCLRPAPAQVLPPRSMRPRRPPQTERPQAAHRGEPTPHRSSRRRTTSPSTKVRQGAPRARTRPLPHSPEVNPVR
jgi:transposase